MKSPYDTGYSFNYQYFDTTSMNNNMQSDKKVGTLPPSVEKPKFNTLQEIADGIKSRLITSIQGTKLANALGQDKYYWLIYGKRFDFVENCFKDSADSRFYSKDDYRPIAIETGDEPLYCHSSENAQRIAFRDERNRKWYLSNVYNRVHLEDAQQWVCQEAHPFINRWRNGLFYTTREVIDEDEVLNAKLAGYHTIRRPENWQDVVGYGVELEIFSKKRGKINQSLPKEHIFGEIDGSLDRAFGIELVGRPFTYRDYVKDKTPWNTVLDFACKNEGKGYNAGDNYGMHISLSKKMFHSSLNAAKFVVFFNQQVDLCKLVAQRDGVFHGKYHNHEKIGSCLDKYRTFTTTKYEPVSVRENRVEVRIFRSTLRKDRFLKNVQFCEAVKDYVIQASIKDIIDDKSGTSKFLVWLNKTDGFYALKKFLLDQSKNVNHIEELKHFKLKKVDKKAPLVANEEI